MESVFFVFCLYSKYPFPNCCINTCSSTLIRYENAKNTGTKAINRESQLFRNNPKPKKVRSANE